MSERAPQATLREVTRAEHAVPQEAPPRPEPAQLPERKGAEPPSPTTADAPVKEVFSYRRRVLLVLSGIVAALGLYWASGYFFAYTDDAFVTSDLVSVAPYVSGR